MSDDRNSGTNSLGPGLFFIIFKQHVKESSNGPR